MIRFIKGILAMAGEHGIVVENHGIGYQIHVPLSVLEALPEIGKEIMLYTYFHVREDAMQLFGFLSPDDLKVFELLINVNGIGPKAGLGILGVMDAYELRYAVIAGDMKAITKAPGIGPKAANKIILELKDKFGLEEWLEEDGSASQEQWPKEENAASQGIVRDAIEALVALGYSKAEAAKAVRGVELADGMTVEELLKKSLKNM